jgi:hypothetical protein
LTSLKGLIGVAVEAKGVEANPFDYLKIITLNLLYLFFFNFMVIEGFISLIYKVILVGKSHLSDFLRKEIVLLELCSLTF